MTLGIDLGTSNTVAATLSRDGHPVIIGDAGNRELRSTPSLILIEDRTALVGQMAVDAMELYPQKNFIRFFKRFFGTGQPVFIDSLGNSWFSETLAAIMLKKLKYDASLATMESIEQLVLTVPAHYNDLQRKSVLLAAQMADMEVNAIIEEPVAAALSFSATHASPDEITLVYDFGGGTFDMSLITRNGNQVHVLAKDGISNLGGKEFDEIISAEIHDVYQRCYGESLPMSPTTINQLRSHSEDIKLFLSTQAKPYYSQWLPLGSHCFEFVQSAAGFRQKSKSLLDQTEAVIQRCLRSLGISFQDLNRILLVGGTCKMPLIKEYWQNKINPATQQIDFYDPLNAVASGAAIYASTLTTASGRIEAPLQLHTVSTYNIAIASGDEKRSYDILINKNSPLPVTAKRIFNMSHFPGGTKVQLVQFWDASEKIFELGTIQIDVAMANMHKQIELIVENKANNTIGVKMTDAISGKPLSVNWDQHKQQQQFNITQQKALLQGLQINNIL